MTILSCYQHTLLIKDIRFIYEHSLYKLQNAQERLFSRGLGHLELSYGDTPSCSHEAFFIGIDEIRSGEHLFYDLRHRQITACKEEEIAMAISCTAWGIPESRFDLIWNRALIMSALPTAMPMRQPVIL